MDRVRELLRAAPAIHADETPARTAGGPRYVHLACTTYLTHMHTGDRSAEAIDAGQVLASQAPCYDQRHSGVTSSLSSSPAAASASSRFSWRA
jgi:hypothetical protein